MLPVLLRLGISRSKDNNFNNLIKYDAILFYFQDDIENRISFFHFSLFTIHNPACRLNQIWFPHLCSLPNIIRGKTLDDLVVPGQQHVYFKISKSIQ